MPHSKVLDQLREMIDAAESNPSHNNQLPPVDLNWTTLSRGVIHEWFGKQAPLSILTHAAWESGQAGGGPVVWIGKKCWPHAHLLVRETDRHLLNCSIFVDPPDDQTRLWSIDLALRCKAVAAVIADGSGLDMPSTRRLQLAVESSTSGGGALALIARPIRDLKRLSAAVTRWRVEAEPSPNDRPRWKVECVRAKGASHLDLNQWIVELDCGKGAQLVSAHVVGGPDSKTTEPLVLQTA